MIFLRMAFWSQVARHLYQRFAFGLARGAHLYTNCTVRTIAPRWLVPSLVALWTRGLDMPYSRDRDTEQTGRRRRTDVLLYICT